MSATWRERISDRYRRTGDREPSQGNIILTLSDGEMKAHLVKWLGDRVSTDSHPEPETVAPIRTERDAFADGMPHCDLLVSPDHAICVDGTLSVPNW